MKNHLLLLTLFCAFAAPAPAGDCAKSTDACSAGSKKLSPFVEASLRQSLPPPAPVTARKHKAVLNQGPTAKVPAKAPEQAAPVSEPAPAPVNRPGEPKLSSPLWLGFIAGGLAGLYYYLSGGRRRRKGGKNDDRLR